MAKHSRTRTDEYLWFELKWRLGALAGLSAAIILFLPGLIWASLCVGFLLGVWIVRQCQSKYTAEQLRLLALLDMRGYEERVLHGGDSELPVEFQLKRARLREEARAAAFSDEEIESALAKGTQRASKLLIPDLVSPFS